VWRFVDSRYAIGLVLVLALAFRLATAVFLGFNAPPDRAACGADTEEFELGAWNIAQGNGFLLWENGEPSAFRAPGYPLMLAGIYRLAGRQFWLNRVVLSVIGTLTCLVVYKLALLLGLGYRVALCSALVVALHPLQAYFCGHFMSEVPSAFLNVLATLLLVRVAQTTDCRLQTADFSWKTEIGSGVGANSAVGLSGEALAETEGRLVRRSFSEDGRSVVCSLRSAVFSLQSSVFGLRSSVFSLFSAGLLNGLSVLVRPAAIFLVPVFGGLLLLAQWRRPVRAMVMVVLFGLGTLAAVAPWTYRNHKVFDRFCLVASNGGSTLWGANNAVTATVGGEHWGGWISTGFDMETKQREVLSLANEVDRDRREWNLGMAFLKQNPGRIPGLLAGKLYRVITPFPQSPNRMFVALAAVSQIVMLALCGIGLISFRPPPSVLRSPSSALRPPSSALHLPALAQLLTLVATVLVFYGSERFRVPYEPILAVYAGAGVVWLLERSRGCGGLDSHKD
jgi:4-amino-4-deoxy-L-arabinose transferase-like glycosyltransferase